MEEKPDHLKADPPVNRLINADVYVATGIIVGLLIFYITFLGLFCCRMNRRPIINRSPRLVLLSSISMRLFLFSQSDPHCLPARSEGHSSLQRSKGLDVDLQRGRRHQSLQCASSLLPLHPAGLSSLRRLRSEQEEQARDQQREHRVRAQLALKCEGAASAAGKLL